MCRETRRIPEDTRAEPEDEYVISHYASRLSDGDLLNILISVDLPDLAMRVGDVGVKAKFEPLRKLVHHPPQFLVWRDWLLFYILFPLPLTPGQIPIFRLKSWSGRAKVYKTIIGFHTIDMINAASEILQCICIQSWEGEIDDFVLFHCCLFTGPNDRLHKYTLIDGETVIPCITTFDT